MDICGCGETHHKESHEDASFSTTSINDVENACTSVWTSFFLERRKEHAGRQFLGMSLQNGAGEADRNKLKVPPPREEPKIQQRGDLLLHHQDSKLRPPQQNRKEDRLLVPYDQQTLQLHSKDPGRHLRLSRSGAGTDKSSCPTHPLARP